MAVNRMFRTCPATGLLYHEPAEKLMRWNAVPGAGFDAESAGEALRVVGDGERNDPDAPDGERLRAERPQRPGHR